MVTAGFLVLMWAVPFAQSAPPPLASTPNAAGDYVFRGSTGALVFHVRHELASDFEAVMARIGQGLDAATDSVRRQQATGWQLFRAAEGTAAAIYVLWVDPVLNGADYDPVRLIAELLPGESQSLYDRLRSAVVKVERLSLSALPRN